MNGSPDKSKGIALITAILVVSIATVLAVSMVTRQQRDIHKTGNILRLEQAWLYIQGIDAWAMGTLDQDQHDNKIDSAADNWNLPIQQTAVAGGELAANISDMQGRFNINNLINEKGVNQLERARFQRLLVNLQLPLELVDAVIDWIDPDSDIRYPNGAEDIVYSNRPIPYRAANTPLVDSTELLSVAGVTPEVYVALAPYIVTLPEPVAININTASEQVLRILADGLSETDAQAIIDARTAEPFETVKQFLEHPALAGLAIKEEGLTTSSHYFQVNGEVHYGALILGYRSIIERKEQTASRVVQRLRREVFDE